jgi:cytoskeleton protein RodZ
MLEIGTSLRRARIGAGLEVTEVEGATMIPARYLDALENEEFERLPPGPYRRSFLREYADFLGLEGGKLVDEYELRFAPPEDEPPPAAQHSWVDRVLDEATPGRLAAVALLAVVGVAVWLLGGSSGTGRAPPVASPPAAARHRTATAPRPPLAPSAPPSAKHVRRAASVLLLKATRGPCWLSVRVGSSSGVTLYSRTLPPGSSVRFGLHRALWIRVGAPWNLDALIGHRLVTSSLPSRTANIVATSGGLRPAG